MPKRADCNRRSPETAPVSEIALGANAILAALDRDEGNSILAAGALVHLPVRAPIYEAERRIREVFFPLDCVISIVTRMEDGGQIEVGTIGREGMSGIPLLMGAAATANDAYCQIPGRAVRIDTDLFRELATNAKVNQLFDRYLQAYVNMLGQLAACNRLHNVYRRCARWLLMSRIASERLRSA